MRAPFYFVLAACVLAAVGTPVPARNALDTGTQENETPFVEEVVVEAQLQVRSPSSRQARTNARVNLQDGTRIAEAKPIS